MSGFHFHFLTEDYTAGGHLLECILVEGSASVDNTTEFYMRLQKMNILPMSLEGAAKVDTERLNSNTIITGSKHGQ